MLLVRRRDESWSEIRDSKRQGLAIWSLVFYSFRHIMLLILRKRFRAIFIDRCRAQDNRDLGRSGLRTSLWSHSNVSAPLVLVSLMLLLDLVRDHHSQIDLLGLVELYLRWSCLNSVIYCSRLLVLRAKDVTWIDICLALDALDRVAEKRHSCMSILFQFSDFLLFLLRYSCRLGLLIDKLRKLRELRNCVLFVRVSEYDRCPRVF